MPGKYALIIGNSEYTDPGLAKLTAPGKDAADFAGILRDPNICAFDDVRTLLNQLSSSAIEAMDEFFDQRKPDDLLVLYFSGHGVRDEFGSLYLAFSNTIRSRLLSTAIKADYIREAMDHSRSRRQVLVLDCCNSGAFPQGTKAEVGGSMGMMNAFQGYGRYVLTASDATQFAWEGDKVIGGTQNSLFTHFLVKGLEGEADRDSDGKITIDDLYDYAFEEISRATPMQTPTKSASKQEGDIVLRQIQRMEDIKPVALPDELVEATDDARTFVREGAVQELEKLLKGRNLGLARSARTALEKIANEDDSLRVRQQATRALMFLRDAEPQATQQGSMEAVAAPPAAPEMPQESPSPHVLSLPEVAAPSIAPTPEEERVPEARPKRKRAARKTPPAPEAAGAPAPRVARSPVIPRDMPVQTEVAAQPALQTGMPPRLAWRMIGIIGAALSVIVIAGLLLAKSPAASLLPSPAPTSIPGTPLPVGLQKITAANATQLVELSRFGRGAISDVAYSPLGNIVAVGSSIGVHIYDANTLKPISTIGGGVRTTRVAFSPDGQTLAAGLGDHSVRLWRVGDGGLLQTLQGHTGLILGLAFSPDGKTLASGSSDNTICLWRVSDGSLLETVQGHTDAVESVAFSPDGQTLASGSSDQTLRLWRVTDGSLLQSLQGTGGEVLSVAFSPDGQTLASASYDDNIRLWRVSDGSLLRTLDDSKGRMRTVVFSPDGSTIAAGSGDESIYLWRVRDGALLRSIPSDIGGIDNIAFSPDGQFLASVAEDGHAMELRRAGSGALLKSLQGYMAYVVSVAFSPDGQELVSSSGDDLFRLWSTGTGTLLRSDQAPTPQGKAGYIRTVRFSPDGQILALGSGDTIQLRRVGDDALLQTLQGHTDSIESLAFSPDGLILASGSSDHTIRLWRISDGSALRTLEGHTDIVSSVAFSPDGQILGSGSWDDTARLWRVSDGVLLQTLQGHTSYVHTVAFSPDGQTLASGSEDHTVRLWRVSDGSLLRSLDGDVPAVESVAFSPDGTILAAGSDHQTLCLWGPSDGRLLYTVRGDVPAIEEIAFSPDGTLVASGSDDGTVRLWGVSK